MACLNNHYIYHSKLFIIVLITIPYSSVITSSAGPQNAPTNDPGAFLVYPGRKLPLSILFLGLVEKTAIKVWVTPGEKAAITVKADLCEKAWWRNFCSLPWARNEP